MFEHGEAEDGHIWKGAHLNQAENTPGREQDCDLFKIAPGIQIAAIAFGWTAQATGAL